MPDPINPKVTALLEKWDGGAGFFDLSFEGDGNLGTAEVDAGGGARALAQDAAQVTGLQGQLELNEVFSDSDYRSELEDHIDRDVAQIVRSVDTNQNWKIEPRELTPEAMRRIAATSPSQRQRLRAFMTPETVHAHGVGLKRIMPNLFDPLDFSSDSVSAAQAAEADEVRSILMTLGLRAADITQGLRASHLAGVPEIPSTPEEQFARQLRAMLVDQKQLSMLDVADLLRTSPLSTPLLGIDELAEALSEEPQRFTHKLVRVTAHPRNMNEDRYKALKYSWLKDKWVRVPVVETTFDLYASPNASPDSAHVSTWQRATGSKLFSGFWLSWSDPSTERATAEVVEVEGRIRSHEGALVLVPAEMSAETDKLKRE